MVAVWGRASVILNHRIQNNSLIPFLNSTYVELRKTHRKKCKYEICVMALYVN